MNDIGNECVNKTAKQLIDSIHYDCYGCGVCQTVCIHDAIIMKENEEGFLYPQLKENLCCSCYQCVKHCQVFTKTKKSTPLQAYAASYSDKQKEFLCSSGGVADALASTFINNGYYVCGCIIDTNCIVKHILTNDLSYMEHFRGSKYVQSYITNEIYKEIAQKLKTNKVLFIGTPCQVAAVKKYIENNAENLFTVDLICHGVPSSLIFQKYINYLSLVHKAKVTSIKFRDKNNLGWGIQGFFTILKHGKERSIPIDGITSSYYHMFCKGSIFRESCYRCQYACTERVGDITIGDFWGVSNDVRIKIGGYGISAMMINTKQGYALYNMISSNVSIENVDIKTIVDGNEALNHPTVKPKLRNVIYHELMNKGYKSIDRLDKKKRRKMIFKRQVQMSIPKCWKQRVRILMKSGDM